ncbi:MAG: hypothetical protein Q7Q73_09290 [Verrucomicrobiota bacterium JB024]|nr:hypothetical protein [Verrucomicrobiota bacterium JB024]
MDELNRILGQVPPVIREQGSSRAKLEALWRILAYGRTGAQTRVAGDLAERWAPMQESPRLPVDDPRKAAKRLERCLSGETAFPLDFALAFIECLPEPFRTAAKVLVFPRAGSAASDLVEILSLDQQHDQRTDHVRFLLATGQHRGMTAEQLEAAAMSYEEDIGSSKQVAAALRAMAQERRGVA